MLALAQEKKTDRIMAEYVRPSDVARRRHCQATATGSWRHHPQPAGIRRRRGNSEL